MQDKACVFPWIDEIKRKNHNGCANPNFDPRGPWCPTDINGVDENGIFYRSSLVYGYCNDNCPIEKEDISNI